MPKLRKVVHVMRRFAPGSWGGTESVVFHVSSELMQRKVTSSIFCTAMHSTPGVDEMDGVIIRRFKYVFPWFGLSLDAREKLALKGGSPLALRLFFALLFEKEVSLIHTHVPLRLGGMARTAAKLRNIPYVVSVHGGHFTLPDEQVASMTAPVRGKPEWGKVFGALFGSRRVLTDADAIICVGKSEYEAMKNRYPEKRVAYVPNGVHVGRFAQADGRAFREQYGFLPTDKLVLCVSRFDPQKNQVGLVQAFAQFAGSHPDHRLVLIGAVAVAAYRNEVEAAIKQHGLNDRVTLIDGLRPDDPLLPGAYKAAEMFVLASVHEPFGIVILEAWAAGLPVVANCVGGIAGFTEHGENILHAEPARLEELSAGMTRLADDVGLRVDLSRRAFGHVAAHYGWDKTTDRICEIYDQCLSGK